MSFDQLKICSVEYSDERTNDANILVLTMAGFLYQYSIEWRQRLKFRYLYNSNGFGKVSESYIKFLAKLKDNWYLNAS